MKSGSIRNIYLHRHPQSESAHGAAWTNSSSPGYRRGSCVSMLFCAGWTSQYNRQSGSTHTWTHAHERTHSRTHTDTTHTHIHSDLAAQKTWPVREGLTIQPAKWMKREREKKERKKCFCAPHRTLEEACVLMRCSNLCKLTALHKNTPPTPNDMQWTVW